jgi:hypothetical protein
MGPLPPFHPVAEVRNGRPCASELPTTRQVGLALPAGLGPAVLRSFVFHATRARGCRRSVEKTPTNAQHMENLTAACPHARLLYVH